MLPYVVPREGTLIKSAEICTNPFLYVTYYIGAANTRRRESLLCRKMLFCNVTLVKPFLYIVNAGKEETKMFNGRFCTLQKHLAATMSFTKAVTEHHPSNGVTINE